jgi:hypothetical protein
MSHRWAVAEVSRSLARLIDQFACAFGFTQLPHGHGEDGHHDRSSGIVESFLGFSFDLELRDLERPFAMGPGLEEIAGLVARQGETP